MPLYQVNGFKSLSNFKERELAAAIIRFHCETFQVNASSVHVNYVYRDGESLDKWFHGPILTGPREISSVPTRTSPHWDGKNPFKAEYYILVKVGGDTNTIWNPFCEQVQKIWDEVLNSGKGGHILKTIMVEKSLVAHWENGKPVALGPDPAPPYAPS